MTSHIKFYKNHVFLTYQYSFLFTKLLTKIVTNKLLSEAHNT